MGITSHVYTIPLKLLNLLICKAIYTYKYFYIKVLTTSACKTLGKS